MKPETASPLQILPFGAQYYRAPTPLREDWENDLSQFASYGFNTIKIWAQWRWNHPEQDRFDFSDLTELMDVADKHGIKVVVNLILDCAPAWLFRLFGDCRMVTADGRRLGPVTTAYRQIGGVPAHCLNHPGAVAESVRFVEATAEALAEHPALLFWDLWNEPELTVGLLREPRVEDLVCFCANCRQAFVRWLAERYGSLESVNAAWSRNYQHWDEIELPVQPHTYRDFIDWRIFFAHAMRDELVRRRNAVRRFDSSHAVMCHTVPPPIFHLATCASDDWLLAESGDLHGNSVGTEPFAADMLRSAARGKPVINAEIHALGGSTFSRPHPISGVEVKRHILTPLAHGIKGFLFWQYRPERLGAESPAWGLTNPDGSPSRWIGDVSAVARAVLRDQEFLLRAKPVGARVAILADPENQLFCFAGTLSADLYARSIRGVYNALYRAGYTIDFVHPKDFESGAFEQYGCIYLPLPYWIQKDVACKLSEWVMKGGNLISEIWPAAYDSRANLHSTVTPGMELDSLFGVTEQISWPEPSGFDAYRMWAETSLAGSVLQIEVDEALGSSAMVGLRLAVSSYDCAGGLTVLGRIPDGSATIVERCAGKGKAVLAGAALGFSAEHEEGQGASELIAALVRRMIGNPEIRVTGNGRADLLSDGNRHLLVVSNIAAEAADLSVQLPPQLAAARSAEGFVGNECPTEIADGILRVRLEAGQVDAWWVI